MIYYLQKILILLKEANNPYKLWYHIHHYLNRKVSVKAAEFISCRNRNDYKKQGIPDVLIPTYDGSDQIVHPDADMFNNTLMLVGTPYPYAMEEYENPCIYSGKNLNALVPLLCPIATQSIHKQGVHLSDPCLLSDLSSVYCVYRETIKESDSIFIRKYVFEKGEPCLDYKGTLLETKGFFALSPAIIFKEDTCLLFYVKKKGDSNSLKCVVYSLPQFAKKIEYMIMVVGLPSHYQLWHISIVNNDYKKIVSSKSPLKGLFLCVSEDDASIYKLFEASTDSPLGNWHIDSEILIPKQYNFYIKFIYKSCYNPQNKKIILSFRDKKDRNRIIEI